MFAIIFDYLIRFIDKRNQRLIIASIIKLLFIIV